MKNKLKTILITFMLVFSTVLLSIGSVSAGTDIITVDDDGPADYSTIQEAINNASPGDTIFVHSGLYYEHIIIDKEITINGENNETTIIDGENTGTVVTIESDYADIVTLSNLTIQNSGSNLNPEDMDAGIKSIEATLQLTNSIIKNHELIGLYLFNGPDILIKNNFFNNVKMYAMEIIGINNGLIKYNTFQDVTYGMYIMNIKNSEISHNTFKKVMQPPYCDILLMYHEQVTITRNHFIGNFGILVLETTDSTAMITENNFINSRPMFGKINIGSPFPITGKETGDISKEMHRLTELIGAQEKTFSSSLFTQLFAKLNRLTNEKSGATWDCNYYSNWNGRGKYMISGIFVFIIKAPLMVILPWCKFDSDPASEPFQI